MSSPPSPSAEPDEHLDIPNLDPFSFYQQLTVNEQFWGSHYNWLLQQGYQLRPRYHPEWQPSWADADPLTWNQREHEDLQVSLYSHLMDATRTSDGSFVKLKMLDMKNSHREVEIGTFLSSKPLDSDPRNRCVPILQVLTLPDDNQRVLIVMPLLLPTFHVPFDTFGEAIDMFKQLFEGLQFMHEHRVAHRDINRLNILMDASGMADGPWHPVRVYKSRDYTRGSTFRTRTQCPPKYYFVDFGISRRYDAGDISPLENQWIGGDKTVPEFQDEAGMPRNPFHTDIYYMGNFIRESFMSPGALGDGFLGFQFMEPLIKDMVQDDPQKRPDMNEVVQRFAEIVKSLHPRKLRSRVIPKDESRFLGLFRTIVHWNRRLGFIVTRRPPIPGM